MTVRVNTKTLLQDIGKQKRKELIKNNQYIHENKYIHGIREEYPLEITIKEFSREEFEKLRELSHHIRKHFFFKHYLLLDEAIAHHLGGIQWNQDNWMLEATLYNLNRLIDEKGSKPTEDDLEEYIETHSLDLKWHPGAAKLAFERMCKRIQEEDQDARGK